jgi:hypothetical protein
MTMALPMIADGVARHPEPERFTTYAARELLAAPVWTPGRCFNPGCKRAFRVARDWQIYCCEACERAGTTELRKWGHKMALPLLTWRLGKYERDDAAIRDRTRAARRFVSHVQSAWVDDRARRAAAAGGA